MVAAEHGFNASTFTARVITATRSDMASAVCGAIGALKGPLHGGAPTEVVSQLHEIGSPERAEQWIDDALDRKEKLMGFGHRVYRAYDPRAAALREVAEGQANMADWLRLAVVVEDIALRKLAERYPDRALKTNVEYYTAAVLQGIDLPPDLFPATFALARHAGWTAHVLEQAAVDKIIRPDVRYIGPASGTCGTTAAPGRTRRPRHCPADRGGTATMPRQDSRGRDTGHAGHDGVLHLERHADGGSDAPGGDRTPRDSSSRPSASGPGELQITLSASASDDTGLLQQGDPGEAHRA